MLYPDPGSYQMNLYPVLTQTSDRSSSNSTLDGSGSNSSIFSIGEKGALLLMVFEITNQPYETPRISAISAFLKEGMRQEQIPSNE